MKSFSDKIAIVTEPRRGIGRALSEELASRPSTVIVADIKLDGATKLASAVAQSGGRASPAMLDVTNEECDGAD